MTHPSSAPFSGMKPGVRALRAGAALLLATLLLVPYPSGAAARISGENAPVAARADGPHIFHLKNGLKRTALSLQKATVHANIRQ